MSWRDYAKAVQDTGHNRHDRHNSGPDRPIVPIVPIVPARPALDPARLFKSWQAGVGALSADHPLHGLETQRWRQLLGDARWLLEHFGQQAARDGWSALDLFGVLPGRDAWGGIADRLRSSRSLVMTSDLALWRRLITGSPESYARGAGELPRLVALWYRC